jgi:hypothetical protein
VLVDEIHGLGLGLKGMHAPVPGNRVRTQDRKRVAVFPPGERVERGVAGHAGDCPEGGALSCVK